MDFDISRGKQSFRKGYEHGIPDTRGLVHPGDLISSLKSDRYFINPNYETDDHSDYNFTSGDPINS